VDKQASGDAMTRLIGHLAILVAFMTLGVGTAEAQAQRANCRYPNMRYCDGCVLDRRILVRVGGTCLFNVRTVGQLIGAETVTPPRLGSFGKANEYQSAYRAGARPGDDFFVYRVRAEIGGRVQTVTIRNFVRITP
jgi:hypothetical protein